MHLPSRTLPRRAATSLRIGPRNLARYRDGAGAAARGEPRRTARCRPQVERAPGTAHDDDDDDAAAPRTPYGRGCSAAARGGESLRGGRARTDAGRPRVHPEEYTNAS